MDHNRSFLFIVPVVLVLASIALFHGMLNRPETGVWYNYAGPGWPFRTPSSSALRLFADLLMVLGSIAGMYSTLLWFYGKSTWKLAASRALLVFSLGLAFNAVRTSGAIGSILGELNGELVLTLEGIALASWFGFSICVVFRDRRRFERWGMFLAACFGLLTTVALVLGLSALASEWVYGGITQIEFWRGRPVIQDSYWDSILARTSWNYLLLFLIPFMVEGWRNFRRGSEEDIGRWFASLMSVAPVLVLVSLLTQISLGAYWRHASHRTYPLWLATLPCLFLIFAMWGRWAGSAKLRRMAYAASFSILAVGVWLLARGPGLYWLHGPPSLMSIWVLVIRYVVPSCLLLGGLAGIFFTKGRIDRMSLGKDQKSLFAWIPSPIFFSGVLLFAILAEYLIRVNLAYRVVFPPVTLFPQTIITASVVAVIGSVLAARQLASIIPMGPRFTASISTGEPGVNLPC